MHRTRLGVMGWVLVLAACSPFSGFEHEHEAGVMDGGDTGPHAELDARDDAADGASDGGQIDAPLVSDIDAGEDAGDGGLDGGPPWMEPPVLTFASVPLIGSDIDGVTVRLTAKGVLDDSFNGGGRSDPTGSFVEVITGIALAPGGKTVGSGYFTQEQGGVAVLSGRLLDDGEADLTFGFGGVSYADYPSTSIDHGVDVSPLPDESVVILANAYDLSGDSQPFLSRFALNVDAGVSVLDPGFGNGGFATLPFDTTDNADAKDLLVGASGEVFVGGDVQGDIFVARLSSAGALDTSFAADGMLRTRLGGFASRGGYLASASGGRLVVVGSDWTGQTGRIGVMRLNADGSDDRAFDGDGRVFVDVDGSKLEDAYAVAVDGSDRIVISGSTTDGTHHARHCVIRLLPSGERDRSFDSDGLLTLTVPGATEYGVAHSLAIGADGTIVVGGTVTIDGRQQMMVARLADDGALDATFDHDGIALVPNGSRDEEMSAFVVDGAGKVTAVGWSAPH